jgi:hypothetical protein
VVDGCARRIPGAARRIAGLALRAAGAARRATGAAPRAAGAARRNAGAARRAAGAARRNAGGRARIAGLAAGAERAAGAAFCLPWPRCADASVIGASAMASVKIAVAIVALNRNMIVAPTSPTTAITPEPVPGSSLCVIVGGECVDLAHESFIARSSISRRNTTNPIRIVRLRERSRHRRTIATQARPVAAVRSGAVAKS